MDADIYLSDRALLVSPGKAQRGVLAFGELAYGASFGDDPPCGGSHWWSGCHARDMGWIDQFVEGVVGWPARTALSDAA